MGNKFFKGKDPQKAIEDALAMKLRADHAAFEFAREAGRAYENAELTDGQRFVFLSKAVMVNKHIHNFIVLCDRRTFEDLQKVLQAYHESCARFRHMRTGALPNINQDVIVVRQPMNLRVYKPVVSREDQPSIDSLSAQLAELSLLVKNNE